MGQYRREPVQLTIQPDVANDVGPVDLEPAVEIMQWHTRDAAHGGVEDTAGKRLAQRILTPLLPTGHEIEAFVELG